LITAITVDYVMSKTSWLDFFPWRPGGCIPAADNFICANTLSFRQMAVKCSSKFWFLPAETACLLGYWRTPKEFYDAAPVPVCGSWACTDDRQRTGRFAIVPGQPSFANSRRFGIRH